MKDVLKEKRVIMVGDKAEEFDGYDGLEARIKRHRRTLQSLEADMSANSTRNAAFWNLISKEANLLAAYAEAADQWLADHDASIAREVEDIRRDIRKLGGEIEGR